MLTSPFKFLDSYTREDREIFFGREREIEELYHQIFESKILLVYGISGTGKSSLINCGLSNKFQDSDWLPVNIRRGGDIIRSMAFSIQQASITPVNTNIDTPAQFKKAIRSLYLDHYKPIYFIFDQFEEIFIFGSSEERKAFAQIVKAITESDLQCRFIFVLREEYLAGITEFENQIPTFLANRVRIEKMTTSNAKQAIEGPCKVFGITLEDKFSESLLDRLCPGCVEVELTYLQVYLDKIYRLATKNKPNTIYFERSLLDQTGNVSDLLGLFLDEQISLLENPENALAILKSFVSVKGTKRQMSLAEVKDYTQLLGKAIPDNSLQELIQTFIQLRILRDKDQSDRYELRHDALAAKVYDKITLAEKEMLELKQFIEDSYNNYNKRGLLFTSDDLDFIGERDSNLKLNEDVKHFIYRSREYKKAKERTVKRLTFASVLVFIFLLVIIVFYIIDNSMENYAIQDASISLTQYQNLKDRYELALSAWETNKNGSTREALVKVLNDIINSDDNDSLLIEIRKKYSTKFDKSPEIIRFAECSDDNKYIIGYSNSYVLLWNRNGKLIREIKLIRKPLINLKISVDSKFIGGISEDSILTIWNFSGKELSTTKVSYNELNTRQIFEFSKDNMVFVLSNQYDAVLVDTCGNVFQTFKHHSGSVNGLDISDNGKFLATASSDKTIDIWYYNTIKKKFDLYNTLTTHRDTVWSVSFASNNVYVVSSSADSTVYITDINNKITSYENLIGVTNYLGKLTKSCYSKFTPKDKAILIQKYDKVDNKKIITNTGIFNSVGELVLEYSYPNISDFIDLTISNETKYFAYSLDSCSFLCGGDLSKRPFPLLLIKKGIMPFFSKDDKYFYSISNSKIESCYIDIDSIF